MKNIKMIAVDMDGTFLKDDMTYNVERFMNQYNQFAERDIRFVVASGNQYYQLISFFPEIKDKISFVAENGAMVVDRGEKIFNAAMNTELVHTVLDVLSHYDDVLYLLCGVDSGYVHESIDDANYEHMNKYYHRLERVSDLYQVDDTIFKFALIADPEILPKVEKELNEKVGHLVNAVISGDRAIDLNVPGINKASGIQKIQEIYSINDQETCAFGDSGNDLEMLQHVKYGFALANARDIVKEVADEIIESNNDEAVLNVIDKILE